MRVSLWRHFHRVVSGPNLSTTGLLSIFKRALSLRQEFFDMNLTNREVGASKQTLGSCNTQNDQVRAWVAEIAELCRPEQIFWCDGSEIEKQRLTAEAVSKGILIELNQEKLPGCYYHRSHTNDVARVEQCTYICTQTADE